MIYSLEESIGGAGRLGLRQFILCNGKITVEWDKSANESGWEKQIAGVSALEGSRLGWAADFQPGFLPSASPNGSPWYLHLL